MRELTVIAIDGDRMAKPQFHAQALFNGAKSKVPTQYASFAGHHFAFIASFAKRVTDNEDIPIAKDPKGFDRAAFLTQVNGKIVEVMIAPKPGLPATPDKKHSP